MTERIDERLEVMGVDTAGMTDEQKFTAATGLTRYTEYEANNAWYVPGGAANVPAGATEPAEPTGDTTPTGPTGDTTPTGSTGEPEVQTYTAEEAAAYNLTLDGALQYGAIKTPAVEAVEGQDAVLYTNEEVDAYNATLPGAKKAGDTKTSTATVETA